MLSHFSRIQLFVTLWTVAGDSPGKNKHHSGLPCPSPGDFAYPGIKPVPLISPTLAGGFFTTSAAWEAPFNLLTSFLRC